MDEPLEVQIFAGSDTISYYYEYGYFNVPTLRSNLYKEVIHFPSVYWFVFSAPSPTSYRKGHVIWRITLKEKPASIPWYHQQYRGEWYVDSYLIRTYSVDYKEDEPISSDLVIEYFDTIATSSSAGRYFKVPIDYEDDELTLSTMIFSDISMEHMATRYYTYGEPPACIDEMRKEWDHLNKTLPREIENSIKHRQEDEIINHYEYDYGELVYSLRDEYTYYILPDVPLKGVGFVRGALETSYTSFIYEKILYLTKDGKEFITLNSYMRATEENQWILRIGWYMQKHTIDSDDYRMEIFRNLKEQMLTGTVSFDHQYRDDLYCTGDDPYHFLDEYILSPEHKERFGHNERQP